MKTIEKYSREERIIATKKFVNEMYYKFHKNGMEWAKITHQSSSFPKGYLGQNLVSLVTGKRGTGTAARGNDLEDRSEVKSCARIGQLGRCNKCKNGVVSYMNKCEKCNSTDISRKTDSHWICAINKNNHKEYRDKIPTIYFLLVDDAELDTEKYLARFRIWTINPPKNEKWKMQYVDDYYEKHKERIRKGEKPAPMNVHPLSSKFNDINPEIIFDGQLDKNGRLKILKFP